MADRQFVYRVIVDTSSARTQAAQIRRVFERELSSIQTKDVQLINPASLRNVQSAIQQQTQAQKQAAQQVAQTQQQVTAATATQSQQRVASAQNEAAARIQAAQRAADQMIAQERRVTAQVQSEANSRQQASSGAGGAGGGLLTAAKGAGIAFLLIQGARKIAEVGQQAAVLNTQIQRTEKAFVTMSGSAATAEARLLAVQSASNNTADRLSAMATVSQIAALKMANTTQEFENLARAGKIVTLLSPSIRDFNDALAQLTLFSNSASFARADQLALDPESVKRVTKELQAANSGLSETQAKLLASVQLLNEKGGKLLDSVEAQASGYEKLTLAQKEFVQGASAVGGAFDMIAGQAAQTIDELAVIMGVGTNRAISELTKSNAEAAKNFAEAVKWIPLINAMAERSADGFQFATTMMDELNAAVKKGIPGALGYRTEVAEMLVDINRWGRVTDEQAVRLREIQLSFKGAADEAFDYARSQEAFDKATNRGKVLGEFLDVLNQVSDAQRDAANIDFGDLQGVEDWRKELNDLRSEFLQTGALTDEQQERLDFLSAAMAKVTAPTSGLAELQQQLGTSFLENNAAAGEYVQQLLDLNAAYANGRVSTDAYKAGVEQIRASLTETATLAKNDFNTALSASTGALAQLDQIIAAGTPGLTAWRDELTGIRDDIISTGNASESQAERVRAISDAINQASTSQVNYGAAVGILGDAFFATNDRAREIVEQLRNLEISYKSGSIAADTYAVSAGSLRNELDTIADNQVSISTEGLDQLGQAIGDLETAVARGLPGADALIQQAIAMEQAIAASGGIVTADQAAQIDAWAAAADSAAISAEILASVQNAVGIEAATNDGIIAGLLSSMANLTGEYNNGAISGDIFAGAMNVLTARLYELLIAAGLTREEVDKLVASLGNIPNADLGSAGGVLGQRLGTTISQSLQAQEESRKRREAERLAKIQESAAKKAATEMENAMKRAAQEFENALKKIPGLFGRSQVTEGQLKLAKAGLPQNFADDWLRRFEDELKNGIDWPDVSVEQANEALERVGVQVTEDANITFQQLVEAWESGLLFSDKVNLELINAEAVKSALELQEKMEEGQQNIIDYFKNVVGIAIDTATGTPIIGGRAASATAGANVPQMVEVVAPDEVQQVLTSGNITITSATLSAVALQDLATKLATQAFSIKISSVTVSAEAAQGLTDTLIKDVDTLSKQLSDALKPVVKPYVVLLRDDYAIDKKILGQFLAPDVTPNIKLDAADLLNAVDTLQALTPNIHPVLSLTEEGKTTFVADVEKLSPSIKARLSYGGATELSDFSVAISDNVPSPGIATTLYTTIEEIQLFRDLVEATVKPKVTVALTLAEETTDEQGNAIASFPDIAGPFAAAIDKQITDAAERFTQQGKDIAGYIALAAYNYSFPDVISRYADLIDFQIAANLERFGTQGGNMTSAIVAGATAYVFPDISLTFVEAVEVQMRSNQERFMRQGTNAMNLITQGMNGFDFSFIATAMVAGVRAGIEKDTTRAAFQAAGLVAAEEIRNGLEQGVDNISWAGILTSAITESVLTELADSLEGQ